MKKLLKGKRFFDIIIEFNSIESYVSSIFAYEETDIVEEIIYNKMIRTLRDVAENTSCILEHFNFIVDGINDSPYNEDGEQESYYVYFHHPEDETEDSVFIEVKLQISDHDYTKLDKDGNIVVDTDRLNNHHKEGSRIDREALEAKLKKNIVTVRPEDIRVADQTIPNLHKALYKIRDLISALAEERNK